MATQLVWHRPVAAGPMPLASPRVQATLLLVGALVIRGWQFGNPVIHVDEEFYLLVGDRMGRGALPYVNIWDRKPIGLFLLYAAMRRLGGDGVIAYQIVATLCTAATAFVVTRMARRIAPPGAAVWAGLLYLLCLGLSGGDGGQAPVYYNLPVAGAAWLVLRAAERPIRSWILGGGAAAMALLGLAMQIKQTSVFEGAFLGLVLLALEWRRTASPQRLLAAACLWVAIALAPAVAAWDWYRLHGIATAYDFANFQSIFLRSPQTTFETAKALSAIILRVGLLVACAIAGWRGAARDGETTPAHRLLLGWASAAIGGVLLFGTYFDHYALPLYAPLCVAAAPVLDGRGVRVWRGRILPYAVVLALLAGCGSARIIANDRWKRGDGTSQRAIVAFLGPRRHDCLFVFAPEPALYRMTGSCLPSRWAFPSHLADRRENNAIGVDPLAEVRRVMALRPHFVVIGDPSVEIDNPRTWRFMTRTLARDYRLAFRAPVGRHWRYVMERMPDR